MNTDVPVCKGPVHELKLAIQENVCIRSSSQVVLSNNFAQKLGAATEASWEEAFPMAWPGDFKDLVEELKKDWKAIAQWVGRAGKTCMRSFQISDVADAPDIEFLGELY